MLDVRHLPALRTAEFERFVNGTDYPMFVVTTSHSGERAGCLAGFVTQVSIDPPRMLVCLSRNNHSFRVAQRAAALAVHVLGIDQHELAVLFGEHSGDQVDKFAACRWHEGPSRIPLLDDAPRWFVGRTADTIPLGDHVGYVLDPVLAGGDSKDPALMFRQVADMSPGHEVG